MKSALIAALLVPAAWAAALPQAEEYNPEPRGEVPDFEAENAKIVGGTEAAAGEFPYIVSLSQGGSHFCGGSLLNANTVITAGHCSDVTASSVRVRAGSLSRTSGGTVVSVSAIRVHPSYGSTSGGAPNNDVALWHLATPIPTSSTIGYVTLPAQGSDPSAGTVTTVAGWGTTSSGSGTLPTTLRRVDVPIISRATCQNQYGTDVNSVMVCAQVSGGGKDSCQGDSGGPLVNPSKTLVGIVSWGQGCALANFAGVYTRVGSFVSWIDANKWTS